MSTEILGIHISDNQLVIAEVKRDNQNVVITAHSVTELKPGIVENGVIINTEELASITKSVLDDKSVGFNTKTAVMSFDESKGFVMTFEIEKNTKDSEIIEMGLKKFEGLIDNRSFKILVNRFVIENSHYAHLIAVNNDVLNSFNNLAAIVGLKLIGLEIESQANARGLIELFSQSGDALININEHNCVISIHDIYGLNFSTLIPFSGLKVDKIIADHLNITPEEAHKLKVEYGLEKENKEGKVIRDIIIKYLKKTIVEIKQATKAYSESYKSKIRRVLLVGELSDLPGVFAYFNENLSQYVIEKGEIWLNFENSRNTYMFSTAVGLALKGHNFQNSLNIFNFVQIVKNSNKGFFSRLFSRNSNKDFMVKNIQRKSEPIIDKEESIVESVLPITQEPSRQDIAVKEIENKIEVEDDKSSPIQEIKTEPEIHKPKVKKLGVLLPADDELISDTKQSKNEQVVSISQSEDSNEKDVPILEAVNIEKIKDNLKKQTLYQRKREKKEVVETPVKLISQTKDIPQGVKESIRLPKKLKIVALVLLISLVFISVFAAITRLGSSEARDLKYRKHYKISVDDIASQSYRIEKISGEFQIEREIIIGSDDEVEEKLILEASNLRATDLSIEIEDKFFVVDEILDTKYLSFRKYPTMMIYNVNTAILIIDKASIYNFVEQEIDEELQAKNLQNYEIDKEKSEINTKIEGQFLEIEVSGSLKMVN